MNTPSTKRSSSSRTPLLIALGCAVLLMLLICIAVAIAFFVAVPVGSGTVGFSESFTVVSAFHCSHEALLAIL